MQSFALEAASGNGIVDRAIPFLARSCIVDNFTPHWLWVDDAYTYVAPYTYGAILLFPVAVQVARVRIETPPLVEEMAGNVGTGYRVTYFTLPLSPYGGNPIQFGTTPTTIASGEVTIVNAGTRVQLPGVPCRSISIKARADNTGLVYVGNATVDSTHYELAARESIEFAINTSSSVWVDAANNGDGIKWLTVH